MVTVPRSLRWWGVAGAITAAAFSIWMYFFPQYIPTAFAWDVQPRMAQVVIGAGYLFRTYFFLLFFFARDYRTLRWAYVGNLFFTGTLMLATLWHAQDVHWRTITAHLWIVLYTMEPIVMHFSMPRGPAAVGLPVRSGGPILPWFRRFLILEVAAAGLLGLLLVINPEWLNLRWAWELNPFDARIVAAWCLGAAAWCGAIIQAEDWDEVRVAAFGNLILGAALALTSLIFYEEFDHTHPTVGVFIAGVSLVAVGTAFFIWRQERARRRVNATEVPPAAVVAN